MIANELKLNPEGDAYDLFSEFQARRDERAYKILGNAAVYVEFLTADGQYSQEVLKAVQIDVLVAPARKATTIKETSDVLKLQR